VAVGEAVFRFWDEQLASLAAVRDLARSLVDRGEVVPNLPALDSALDLLTRERGRAHANWPWLRPEDEAAARAAVARGEPIPLEEVVGGLPRPNHQPGTGPDDGMEPAPGGVR